MIKNKYLKITNWGKDLWDIDDATGKIQWKETSNNYLRYTLVLEVLLISSKCQNIKLKGVKRITSP